MSKTKLIGACMLALLTVCGFLSMGARAQDIEWERFTDSARGISLEYPGSAGWGGLPGNILRAMQDSGSEGLEDIIFYILYSGEEGDTSMLSYAISDGNASDAFAGEDIRALQSSRGTAMLRWRQWASV